MFEPPTTRRYGGWCERELSGVSPLSPTRFDVDLREEVVHAELVQGEAPTGVLLEPVEQRGALGDEPPPHGVGVDSLAGVDQDVELRDHVEPLAGRRLLIAHGEAVLARVSGDHERGGPVHGPVELVGLTVEDGLPPGALAAGVRVAVGDGDTVYGALAVDGELEHISREVDGPSILERM